MKTTLIFARWKLTLACCLALTLLGTASRSAAQPAPAIETLPFSQGEDLVYQAEFNRALLRGIDVAEFRFSVRAVDNASGDAGGLRLVGDVVTKGFFTKLAGFHVHERFESLSDPDSFTVMRTTKLDEQGKRVRTSEAIFDHKERKVTWTERDPKQTQPPRITTAEFSEPVQDILTVIYYLRTQQLAVGKSFTVPVSDSGRVYDVAVTVRERKQIKTVVGKVNAFRVEPALFGENNLIRSRGTLSIWITDDSRRLPVKAQLKVEIGTFDIKLKRVIYHEATTRR